MKPTIKRLFLLISLLLSSSGLYFADAQSYIRYVVPEDFGTHAVYADSVLTSIALPRGVSKLANYPKFNAAAYELSQVLQDPGKKVLQVWVCGSASPDGLWGYNVKLSKERTDEAAAYLKDVLHLPDSLIHKESLNEDWDRLAELVEASGMEYADQVIDIIRTKTWGERKTALQALDEGKVWAKLCSDFFPALRCVRFAIYCQWDPSKPHLSAPESVIIRDTMVLKEFVRDTMYVKEVVEVKDTVFIRDTVVVKETVPAAAPVKVAETQQTKKEKFWLKPNVIAVKTNLLADAMAIPSLGLEVQLYKGLSLDVSGSYGFFNVFNKVDRDMSLWYVSPELRYWLGEHPLQRGSFIGLHANVCNYSLEWRDGVAYQTVPGHEAWSAGFTYGACARMGKKSHWGLEFVIGVGYGRYYQNIGTVEGGKFVVNEAAGPQLKEHFGVTKLAVNLVYRFSVAGKNKK